MKPCQVIFLGVLTCTWSAAAWGDVILPTATGSTLCEGAAPFPIQDPSACTVAGGAIGSVQGAPFVQLMSHAAVPTGGVSSQALTSLRYFFEVVGGIAGDHVPLLIQTGLDASAVGGEAFAAANIQVFTNSILTVVAVCTDGSCPFGTDFSGTFGVDAVSGQVASVLLVTQAAIGGLVGGTADASADPFIFVDPAFSGATNYQIVVSAGIGNSASTVPEPSSFVLVVFGMAVLGWWSRKRFHGPVLQRRSRGSSLEHPPWDPAAQN